MSEVKINKQDILYNFDWKLDNYKDRLEYVKKYKEPYLYNTNYGANFIKTLHETVSQYLLRSKDCESNRQIDYSFYDEDRKFNAEYSYRDNKSYKNNDKDYPIQDDYVVKSILTSFDEVYDDSQYNLLDFVDRGRYENINIMIDKLIKNDKMTLRKLFMLKSSINHFKYIEHRILLEDYVKDKIERLEKAINDDIDKNIISLIEQEYNNSEISEKLNIARKTVYNRIKKIEGYVFNR